MTYSGDRTIVAIATPPGQGAITLVRLSGLQAKEFANQRFRARGQPDWIARRPLLGYFLDCHGNPLDQVLLTFFPGPASYTGEDLVEISCHGSPVVARQLVEGLVELGAHLAEPGEFTWRAFLNGKMDLAQAEAVRGLIESQTAFQAKVAAEQLEGKVSRTLKPIKDEIVRILCQMETALEFVEDEVELQERGELLEALQTADRQLEQLEESFSFGRIVQEGITVSITGKPNAGKSSLFNALVLDDRVIVTDVPGTTLDAVTETIDLEGIPARLVDTAGIREAKDALEKLGVQKSLEYLRQAEVVLFVLDQTTPFGEEDFRVWDLVRERCCVLVINKEDLPGRLQVPPEVEKACAATVRVSALEGTHLQELRSSLLKAVTREHRIEREGVMITSIRHKHCIEATRKFLQAGIESYGRGMSEEFPLYDFRKALESLGQITGETTAEDILEEIFSTFCIGK
ncbi:MAG: tRNA uridine-5-carboxymethylaminomethyl(34) synthesis GTPase MnmE [Acidobacteria bacterium]|nr:tRNA uridine-5-carboxymethylaminomethyl(34) synthesis GTPase MnmE [Acidobacteriota bacterium]